jgi:hypothetical protein
LNTYLLKKFQNWTIIGSNMDVQKVVQIFPTACMDPTTSAQTPCIHMDPTLSAGIPMCSHGH